MSAWERTKQWVTFARCWHVFDARWQNPYESAKLISHYLNGLYKPIYHPLNECGDHVVVINTKQIALPGDEWRWRTYYHHTGYAKGGSYTRAWELHDKDPILVMKKAVYSTMSGGFKRRHTMERLHLFPDDKIPEEIRERITNQIRPLKLIPRALDTYSEEEVRNFPKVFDLPDDYIPR